MESYSAWNQRCGWKAPCRRVAGYPEYHFILDEGKLYRLKANETRAVLVKDLPIKPKGIRWGGGALWLSSDFGRSDRFLDPVSLECKTDLVLLKFFSLFPRAEILSITTDTLFLKRHSDEEDKDILYCLDRKTHKLSRELYKAKCYYFNFVNFGPDFVQLLEPLLTKPLDWEPIVDSEGNITPLGMHPDVKPLLPRIMRKLKELNEEEIEDDLSECRTKRERLGYLFNRIRFIDFFARKLYFVTSGWSPAAISKPIYVLPFDGGPVDVAWRSPNDFSKATWQPDLDPEPWDTANNAWERVLLFDGAHAVGLDKSGANWIFQTPEGEVIDLGKFDCVEDNYALLGDELYVLIKDDGWYKFHLAHDVPEARKIEFIEEE